MPDQNCLLTKLQVHLLEPLDEEAMFQDLMCGAQGCLDGSLKNSDFINVVKAIRDTHLSTQESMANAIVSVLWAIGSQVTLPFTLLEEENLNLLLI